MIKWSLLRRCPKEILPGGKGAGRRPADFDFAQLRIGTRVEFEHTRNACVAQEIAMDHLSERPDYYIRLLKMEKLPVLKPKRRR